MHEMRDNRWSLHVRISPPFCLPCADKKRSRGPPNLQETMRVTPGSRLSSAFDLAGLLLLSVVRQVSMPRDSREGACGIYPSGLFLLFHPPAKLQDTNLYGLQKQRKSLLRQGCRHCAAETSEQKQWLIPNTGDENTITDIPYKWLTRLVRKQTRLVLLTLSPPSGTTEAIITPPPALSRQTARNVAPFCAPLLPHPRLHRVTTWRSAA